ncbi:DUF4158 domain-containing protein [Micromonospora sp. NPDC049460]|uniref:DUF4158 domain-containing protein n=1 Tax=unclassified Micromonospora TaxID=2617518 RepID=UPI0037198BBA
MGWPHDQAPPQAYLEREKTRFEHQWEICEVYGFTGYADSEAALLEWVDQQAWTTGDQPKVLFYAAVAWLRTRRVLLPGVTTLRDQVASVRRAARMRMHAMLHAAVAGEQAHLLDKMPV